MSPPEIAAVLVAYSLAASRTLTAGKELWAKFLPAKVQWVPGAVILAGTMLEERLRLGVVSWTDLLVPVLLVLGAVVPGARSATHVAVTELAEERAETSKLAQAQLDKATGSVAPPPMFPPPSVEEVATDPLPGPQAKMFPLPASLPDASRDEDQASLSETPHKLTEAAPEKPVKKEKKL